MQEKQDIIKQLESLTSEPGYIYTLAILLRHDLFLNPEELADINWFERLSFQEFTFLIGLMVKNPIDLRVPTPDESSKQASGTYELFSKLHMTHGQPFFEAIEKNKETFGTMSDEEKNQLFNEVFGSGEMMSEPIFYGNSGAYDFQYLEFAPKKYRYDTDWLLRNKLINIEVIAAICSKLKKICEEKLRNFQKVETFEDFCRANLEIFLFRKADIRNLGVDGVHAFLEHFSIKPNETNQDFLNLGQYNAAESHPIIVLDEDCYFLPISFNLAQSVYESPSYWMSSDESYKETFFKNKGSSTEEMACELLSQVFGVENVYRGVTVKKSKKVLVSDIDVLAIAGNKAVILQAKSKRLTELSKRGNTEQLKTDFELAIQKSYEQGLICRKAVLERQCVLEDSAGTIINLDESIDDAYIICITSDHYPAITHQVNVYLKKLPNEPYPLAMNIFDLDILSFYLRDPFEFLYYLRQRINLADYYNSISEMALLGFHLNKKLFRLPNYDRESIHESFAQLIDANFPATRGYQPQTKAVQRLHHKWKNEHFQQLIKEIKDTKEPGFTDAIFFLYDLAGAGADHLIKMIEQTKKRTLSDRQDHDCNLIYDNGKSGFSYLCLVDSPERLKKTLSMYTVVRKYKDRADKWLSIGSLASSSRIADVVVFNIGPWKYDETLESIAQVAIKKGSPINKDGSKLGRNDPCFCGSGKKYKKCCGR